MKLSQYRADYYVHSGKASDVARQLSLAGIALIWVLKLDGKPYPTIPKELLLPSALLILALAADLLQYVLATIIWGSFHRFHEKKLTEANEDPDLTAHRSFNWPIQFFFILKLVSVIIAYILMLAYLWQIWFASMKS